MFEPLDLAGRTLGIVGYGDIGRAIAERAHRLGMKVIALRRRPLLSAADPWVDETLPQEELLGLMRRADDVVVATPLTAETRGLVGEQAIGAMKPGGVLVNVGRGPVVDEAALARALARGQDPRRRARRVRDRAAAARLPALGARQPAAVPPLRRQHARAGSRRRCGRSSGTWTASAAASGC